MGVIRAKIIRAIGRNFLPGIFFSEKLALQKLQPLKNAFENFDPKPWNRKVL